MILLAMLGLALFGCSSKQPEEKETAAVQEEETTEPDETAEPDADPVDTKASDGIIDFKTSKDHLKYIGHELTKDFNGEDAIVINYEYTNLSDESRSASYGIYVTPFQEGIECEMTFPGQTTEGFDNMVKQIKKDVTLQVSSMYKLKNLTDDVELEATDLTDFTAEKQTQVLKLSDATESTQEVAASSTISEETPTPAETATETPTPDPTAEPVTEPNVYSGSGDSVIDVEAPAGNNGLCVYYITGNAGAKHFAVKGYDAEGDRTDLFVNTTDPYEGMTADLSLKTVQMEISAQGDWNIEVRSMLTCRRVNLSEPLEGSGDEILIVEGSPSTATISGNEAAKHFAVKAHGSRSNLLVNTTDPYEGTTKVKSDALVIEVKAQGAWQITLE